MAGNRLDRLKAPVVAADLEELLERPSRLRHRPDVVDSFQRPRHLEKLRPVTARDATSAYASNDRAPHRCGEAHRATVPGIVEATPQQVRSCSKTLLQCAMRTDPRDRASGGPEC